MRKYCPRCGLKYDNAQQRFCLSDGALLSLPDSYRLVGSTLDDKYKIDALVGIGGFGAVYSAHHLGLDRQVAFKILQPNVALQAPETVNLFESEAKTAARLLHENIVTIYDAGRTLDNISYIAMEWIEGLALDEEMAMRGQLSFERTIEILWQVASALAFAHFNRTVHRDLKPSNVMLVRRLGGSEQVKVVDFGIAKVLSSAVASTISRSIGTPAYASPEQWKHGAQIDGRADIYALGVMLFEMITGSLPFKAQNVEELIRLKLNTAPPPLRSLLPDAPAAVEKLLQQMMAIDPNRRPHQVSEVPALFEAACKTFADTPLIDAFATTAETKGAESLPIPLTQSTPFTATVQRAASEPSRADVLSDQREPITSVFAPEDFDEGSNLKYRQLFILVMLIALGIGGLAVGVTAYLKQQAQARTDQRQAQIKIENQNQKDGRIGSLSERIAEINKLLQASDKPSWEKKRDDISERLKNLSLRLDDISKMSPDQMSEISQACDEIGKELDKIEEEVKDLRGLLPSLETNRDPIKV
ncbi:MAG: DUF6474 family protein [Blastocatellia bacterium]